MTVRLSLLLGLAIFVAAGFALTFGEVALTAEQYRLAFSDAASVEAEVLWAVRAPRIVCALTFQRTSASTDAPSVNASRY